MKDFEKFVKHLRFEALALAVLMFVLAYKSQYSLWWLLAGFPIVDICLVGYLFGPKIGALTYNLAHNAALPTTLIAIGITFNKPVYLWLASSGHSIAPWIEF